MRKRTIDIHLFLNEQEFALLNELSMKMKTSKSQVLRFLLNSSVLVEAPSIDYRKWIRELRMIGNNINQITKNHNSKLYRKEDRELLSAYMKKLNLLVKEAVEKIGNQ